MKKITTLIMAFLLSLGCMAQKATETFNESNIKAIFVSNIEGNVSIVGNQSSSIKVTHERKGGADDYGIYYKVHNDTLTVIVERASYYKPKTWDFEKPFPHCIRPAKEKDWSIPPFVDFVISVPKNLIVKASTINDGDITVSDVKNEIWANNINGSIEIENAREVRNVHTINGEVAVSFTKNPTKSGKYFTLNGDINVQFLPGIQSDFSFKSFQGEFFTDIDEIEILPKQIKRIEKKDKLKIKVDKRMFMKVGNGGVACAFETFNGDAFVKVK